MQDPKLLDDETELEGRTILKVRSNWVDNSLFIQFTDGTYCKLRVGYEYDSEDVEFATRLEPHDYEFLGIERPVQK